MRLWRLVIRVILLQIPHGSRSHEFTTICSTMRLLPQIGYSFFATNSFLTGSAQNRGVYSTELLDALGQQCSTRLEGQAFSNFITLITRCGSASAWTICHSAIRLVYQDHLIEFETRNSTGVGLLTSNSRYSTNTRGRQQHVN